MSASNEWPFPSVQLVSLRTPDGHTHIGLSGELDVVQAYLDYCGAIPAVDDTTGERRIVTVGPDNEWVVAPPSGSTKLERAPIEISDEKEALSVLTGHRWYSVGWTVNPTLVEFDLSEEGEGFSRFGEWGFDNTIGHIVDVYWRFQVSGNVLNVAWEDGEQSAIRIQLRRELHVAKRLNGKGLSFSEVALTVDRHLFPREHDFINSWPKEYWGKPRSTVAR